jgi:hypothetical protein
VKAVVLVFFDHRGTVHYEFTPEGQKINQDVYLAALRRLQDAVRRKRPEMWTPGSWLLHRDNAPAHTALSIIQFLAKPPYPPDLSPPDLFLFPKTQITLKGTRF